MANQRHIEEELKNLIRKLKENQATTLLTEDDQDYITALYDEQENVYDEEGTEYEGESCDENV